MNTSPSMLRRLVIGFAGAFIALTFMSALIVYSMIANQLRADRQLVLRDRASAVTQLISAGDFTELHHRIEAEWPLRGGEKVFIRVLDGEGQRVSETPNMPEVLSPDHFLVRELTFDQAVGLKSPLRVITAIGAEQSQDFLATTRATLIAVFFLNVLVSLFVGHQLVRKEMLPLQAISEKIARIDSLNLHERLETKRLPLELRQLAVSFNNTLDRLADAFARLSRYSSDIAHELRTPIANMMGTIEVALNRERSLSEYHEILESNLEECARIHRICDGLLFLARAENMREPLPLRPYPMRAELEGVLEFFEPLASERNVRLSLEESTSPDEAFPIEATLLQRALGNLVANAIKYTLSGGRVRVGYEIQSEGERRRLRLFVSDNGPGIPEKDLPFIFDRFYRVDPSRNIGSGGTGLGLAIVKSIAELHGGTIEVESQVGTGTKFTMTLPDSPTAT